MIPCAEISRYLRRNQGKLTEGPAWIVRTLEMMGISFDPQRLAESVPWGRCLGASCVSILKCAGCPPRQATLPACLPAGRGFSCSPVLPLPVKAPPRPAPPALPQRCAELHAVARYGPRVDRVEQEGVLRGGGVQQLGGAGPHSVSLGPCEAGQPAGRATPAAEAWGYGVRLATPPS